ncbi:MAG: hypothetical protein AAGC93_00260 [Cyanobacteria bacterium P01_F01_bin.53]
MTSTTFSTSLEAQQAAVLLEGYHFELGGHDARQWVSLWLEFYQPGWIRDAVIEALYQGRYKSVSVRQILDLWQRRAKPIRHVTHEFESAVCREFGPIKSDTVSSGSSAMSLNGQNGAALSNGQSLLVQSVNGQSANGKALRQEPQPYQPIPPRKKPPEKPYTGRQAWRNYASGGPYVEVSTTAPSQKQPSDKPTMGSANGMTASVAAAKTLHRSPANAVSFNLAELAVVPGMTPLTDASSEDAASSAQSFQASIPPNTSMSSNSMSSNNGAVSGTTDESHHEDNKEGKRLDNSAWREFPSFTTATHAPADPEDTLRLQRQSNGVLYSSARAIQPFKPALPFSAKTLRMAQQKATAGLPTR